ncbi:MAG TPA: thiosulfate oxidation carrier protein SoxY [Burkholderiales bacterium]|nr:thiosulfate oxidation carrier protein SoxY [Burkholderiales bacterium]
MDVTRRQALKTGGGAALLGALFAAGFLKPQDARAAAAGWNEAAFAGKTMDETLKAIGAGKPSQSTSIMLTAPDIAENGAVVPVTVQSSLPNTESIAILIEKNPNTLAASFNLPSGTEPLVGTRVKMGETSNVYALVKADGKYYTAVKEIKVTLGGCGG